MTPWRQLDLLKGPRQRGTRPKPALERETHIAIADLLAVGAAPGWICTHYPLGEFRTEKTGALLKRMGNRPGFFDWLLISPAGVHHWLELKRPPNKLTDAQEMFQAEMTRRGVPNAVARSYAEAEAQLRAWGALRLTVAA